MSGSKQKKFIVHLLEDVLRILKVNMCLVFMTRQSSITRAFAISYAIKTHTLVQLHERMFPASFVILCSFVIPLAKTFSVSDLYLFTIGVGMEKTSMNENIKVCLLKKRNLTGG